MPKLTHPDSKTEIEVGPDHLDAYLSQGWETKTKPTAKTPTTEVDDEK